MADIPIDIFAYGVPERVLNEFENAFGPRFRFVTVANEMALREQLSRVAAPVVLCGNTDCLKSEVSLVGRLSEWHQAAQVIVLIELPGVAATLEALQARHRFRYISLPLDRFAACQTLEAAAETAALQKENSQLIGDLERYFSTLREISEERFKQLMQDRDEYRQQYRRLLESIRNAEHIQRAVLPSEEKLEAVIPQYMLIYRPRDIVSGDFYWMHIVKDEERTAFYLAVADCTGHGIPGAFLAMVGMTLLNQVVAQHPWQPPGRILGHLHDGFRHVLRQRQQPIDDGMEVCLCRLEGTQVTFAGARRPLYIVSPSDDQQWFLQELKGDKRTIGGGRKYERWRYTDRELEVPCGTMLYLTTDGYADQSNPQSERYGAHRLRNKLLEVAPMTCTGQRFALEKELLHFQQNERQRDDITMLGVRVPIVSGTAQQLPSGSFSITGNLIL